MKISEIEKVIKEMSDKEKEIYSKDRDLYLELMLYKHWQQNNN